MKIQEFQHQPVKPDTYEASMALNQLMRIGKHAIKLHNMIDDAAEMESWVAKKIDLAGDYVKKVYNYTEGEKAGLYDDGGMSEMKKMPKGTGTMYGVKEDAGEGHMSKSTLYHTAKYAIALMQMIKPGDDLEGWVQSKLNKAADYLQGVYNYEEYQKLNPYREELDSSLMQRHAGIIQKHLDEILERKCRAEDVDTKPGMMRILAKRVNEVEKEIAKENRKQTDEGPLDGIGKAIGTAARGLGAKAAGKLGMKKTAAGLQGRVDVDKKSAELDTALAQYIGQQRGDKNRIDQKTLQGFFQKQGIDQKYMQYVNCLLYTSPSPRDRQKSRMPSSA